ncbi:DnaB-like helicase C-terminal domain-containing protein [Streptococcus orisratti]|uniref:DnaB-like helicase C-terminal domain-containing protein n=1 Tax=Streptococcus orisratti TaxID=114652 RepID=UPI000370BB7C|nr:DnaB-like helicase C-terminal domain-containing protein [Streptococcus orisratti]
MPLNQIKNQLTNYVKGLTEHSIKGNRKGYICPLCGSGTGRNKTGALSIDKDGLRWKCFSCGRGGDIFDLIGFVEGIDNFSDQLNRASEIFNIPLGNYSQYDFTNHHNDLNKKYKTISEKEGQDFIDFYKEAHAHINETDYAHKRGLSDETLNRFMIGYVKNWKHPNASENITGSPRLIIPTARDSYFARDTRDEIPECQQNYAKSKVGKVNIFNGNALKKIFEKPIFIVEGEIDALSIMEVGGVAVGLGGTSNIQKLLKTLEGTKLQHPLILSLDNDSAGREMQEKLAHQLKVKGIPYKIAKLTVGDIKDPNEMLVTDRQTFSKLVAEASNIPQDEKECHLNLSTNRHLQNFVDEIADGDNALFIPTNFKGLDKLLDGGLYDGLYIVGAISSLGKTTIVTQIADQIAEQGYDVLIISLEMARKEIMAKSISRNTVKEVMTNDGDIRNAKTVRGITTGSRYENYNSEEIKLIQNAVKSYSQYANHIYIVEGIGDIDVDKVRTIVSNHQKFTDNTPVVVIDYLQILAPFNERATDKQNTDKAVIELKRISRDFKTPVIAISSFNRDSYNNIASMQSFKESGAIEYSSDVLIGLQFKGVGEIGFDVNDAKSRNPREIELVILKNRNGRAGTKIGFDFYAMFNYFDEKKES